MRRIRFHGRGGQGMKTASRIVSTAAFREGYDTQDAPIYGAERRGAPMAAFTRIDHAPILERGMIAAPDLVVVADETLFDDPQAGVLRGLQASGTVLANSAHAPALLRERYGIVPALAVLDFTGLVLSHVGSLAALSVALGAATCRVAGLCTSSVEQAVQEELEALGLSADRIERNLDLARLCYERVDVWLPVQPAAVPAPVAVSRPQVVTLTYQGPWRGTPSVAAPANTPLRKTGNWRVWRPVIDLARCTQCWMCFVSCPDGAIALDDADTPHIDYEVCKGCLVCVEECPTHTIHTLREAEV